MTDWGVIVPTLHAFYGSAPVPSGSWLDVPVAVLRAYGTMLPVLQAQQQLRAVDAHQLGTPGAVAKGSRSQVLRDLRKQGRVPGETTVASPDGLRAQGVTVDRRARPSWADELGG